MYLERLNEKFGYLRDLILRLPSKWDIIKQLNEVLVMIESDDLTDIYAPYVERIASYIGALLERLETSEGKLKEYEVDLIDCALNRCAEIVEALRDDLNCAGELKELSGFLSLNGIRFPLAGKSAVFIGRGLGDTLVIRVPRGETLNELVRSAARRECGDAELDTGIEVSNVVSRCHALIVGTDRGTYLVNTGKYEILVNGVPLGPGEELMLRDGYEIVLMGSGVVIKFLEGRGT